jgi:hypothetical protein
MTASSAVEPSQWSKKFLVGDDQTCGRKVELHHGQTEETMSPEPSITMLSDQLELVLRRA